MASLVTDVFPTVLLVSLLIYPYNIIQIRFQIIQSRWIITWNQQCVCLLLVLAAVIPFLSMKMCIVNYTQQPQLQLGGKVHLGFQIFVLSVLPPIEFRSIKLDMVRWLKSTIQNHPFPLF
jgi:hypothetical protein